MSRATSAPHSPAAGASDARVRAAAIILAGGSGSRFAAQLSEAERATAPANKVYQPLAGRAAISWSIEAALTCPEVTTLVLVTKPDERALAHELLARDLPHLAEHLAQIVNADGGASRHASEQSGLNAVRALAEAGEVDVIALHDGARPVPSAADWSRLIQAAAQHGGAIPTVDVDDAYRMEAGQLQPSEQRRLVRVQTPQAFSAAELLQAYDAAALDGFEGTDTSACLERYSDLKVTAVVGSATNLKITYAPDVAAAERLLAQRST